MTALSIVILCKGIRYKLTFEWVLEEIYVIFQSSASDKEKKIKKEDVSVTKGIFLVVLGGDL